MPLQRNWLFGLGEGGKVGVVVWLIQVDGQLDPQANIYDSLVQKYINFYLELLVYLA